MTLAPSKLGIPKKTVLGGGMDITLARDKTVVGNKTVLEGGMDVTMAAEADMNNSQDSVFDNSMLTEFKASLEAQKSSGLPDSAELIASLSVSHTHHPSTAELPGSLPTSADTSVDYGATATVKF